MAEHPTGFTSLGVAMYTLEKDVNIMGVVTDFMAPSKTSGTDWQITFSIADDLGCGPGTRVKFFRPEHSLPVIRNFGDVIMIRNIRYKDYRGSKSFLSNHQTSWVVFNASVFPSEEPSEESCDLPFHRCRSSVSSKANPSKKAMKFAWHLNDSRKGLAPRPSSTNLVSNAGKKGFRLVESITVDGFFDFIGEVVSLFDKLGKMEMKFTDYSSNKLLFNYKRSGAPGGREGDEFNCLPNRVHDWKGPPGQHTISMTLWQPHSQWCSQNVKEGDFVELRNVRVKLTNNGQGILEGVLHTDHQDAERVNIRKLFRNEAEADERIMNLLKRKQQLIQHSGDWRKGETVGKPAANGGGEPPSKKISMKRKRKNEKKAKAALAASAPKNDTKSQTSQRQKEQDGGGDNDDSAFISRNERRMALNRVNENIVCANQDRPLRPLSKILDSSETHLFKTKGGNNMILDYQNIQCRATVRVVDFYPHDLRDFSYRKRISEFDVLREASDDQDLGQDDGDDDDESFSDNSSDGGEAAEPEPSMTPNGTSEVRQGSYEWEWRFSLLVEDRDVPRGQNAPRMVLHVVGDDAEFLLNGIKACNLWKTKNAKKLGQLTEKLFHLWGDLEERKHQLEPRSDAGSRRKVLEETDGNATRIGSCETKIAPVRERPKSRPFECCIKEYGVSVRGVNVPRWHRRFQIFGTVIKG